MCNCPHCLLITRVIFSVTYPKGDSKKKKKKRTQLAIRLEEAELILTCNCVPLQTPALRIIAVAISFDFKVTDRGGIPPSSVL